MEKFSELFYSLQTIPYCSLDSKTFLASSLAWETLALIRDHLWSYCLILFVTLSLTFKSICCYHKSRNRRLKLRSPSQEQSANNNNNNNNIARHNLNNHPQLQQQQHMAFQHPQPPPQPHQHPLHPNQPEVQQPRGRVLCHDHEIQRSLQSHQRSPRDCRIPQMHWTVHIKGGPRRVNHAGVNVGYAIYSFGGYCTGENYAVIRNIDVYVLNQVTYRWNLLETDGTIPFQRYGHTAVAYGRFVYLWGGRNDNSACKILYRFDTKTHRWERPPVNGIVPGARDGHSAVVIRNKMFIFGGYEESIGMFSQDVHALDLETLTWSFIPTAGVPPSFRDFHTATVYLDRYMFIFGGRGDEHGPLHTRKEMYCNTLVCFDVERQEWFRPKTTGVSPVGRRSHSAFMHNGFMYIFGGYNGVSDEHFNDMFRYDPETGEWQQVTPFGHGPAPRRRQGCVVIDNRVFFFGGTSPITNLTDYVNLNQPEEQDMNLTDHDDMFVLDMDPTLKTLSILKICEHNLDTSMLPLVLKWDIAWTMMPNKITPLSSVTVFFALLITLSLKESKSESIEGINYLQPLCSLELIGATSAKQEILYTVNLTYSDHQNGLCSQEKSSAGKFSQFVKCDSGIIYVESGFANRDDGDSFDRIRINCSSNQPVKYEQDVELPFAGMEVTFHKRILPGILLHEVSARFPKILGVAGEGLLAFSGTYKFSSKSWSFPITLNITTPRTSRRSVLISTSALSQGIELAPEVLINDNYATCQTKVSTSYVYFVNIGGANNPTEAKLLINCLNMTMVNTCGNKHSGTNCNQDRHCKKISPFHQNGMFRCSNRGLSRDIEYFRDINTDIQQNMSKIWDPSLVIMIEKEGNSLEFQIPDQNHGADEEIENVSNSSTSKEFLAEPGNITLYNMQVARFECHFIHYVLVTPVVWYVGWKNGTKTPLLVDNGENTTEETRFVNNYGYGGKVEKISVDMKSSHLEFQAKDGMVNITCEMWYWDSELSASSLQKLEVKASKQPKFDEGPVKHMETGETLKLDCLERNGIPHVDYKWEFNGEALDEDTTLIWNNENQRNASVLEIPRIGKSHSGEYTCIAYNFRGEARKIFAVTVDDSVKKLWLALSITSVVLFFVLVVALAGLYELYVKQRSRLTKLEIKEFLSGNVAEIETNSFAHVNAKYMVYDKKFELPWSQFKLDSQILGKGVHGVVYKGTIGEEIIAVKTVRERVTKDVLKALLDELKIMIYLGKHDYIVELKGACTQFLHEGRAYVLVEFCSLGSIESFLRNNRYNFCDDSHAGDYANGCGVRRGSVTVAQQFNRKDLIQWSVQILQGMQYLEEKKVIHGDLATRNILMQSLHHVKITDFGLSRQLINTDSYVKKQQGLLPWRHMAIEALRDFTFTTKSDVWSYGVTLWEILTLGTTPYPGMNWKPEFLQLLENDLRLYKPKYATKAMYKILTDCWAPEPEDRPSFQQLRRKFSEYMAHL
ncbi:unnamed protein product [Allacma fusca]|uniref:Receptor protein-tyrosine kinase n=1 Tax=Allacma fusca TaxID=39272 RepID=A0A8J2JXY6_9HEXA|nr:unnamed protein product [Allacma fusca]